MKWLLENNSGSYSLWQCLCECYHVGREENIQLIRLPLAFLSEFAPDTVDSPTSNWLLTQSRISYLKIRKINEEWFGQLFIWFFKSENILSLLRKCDIRSAFILSVKTFQLWKNITFYFSLCLKLAHWLQLLKKDT